MWHLRLDMSLAPVILGATALFAPLPSAGQEGLFSSNEVIDLKLLADWDVLDGDREQASTERPGQVFWTGPDGHETTIPIQLRTRGDFRLQKKNCPFPPLRLNFPSEGTEGTVFQGQDKLKLVTHCRDRDDYEQNLLEEYLAYRIYNLLTPISFRVRLARITYLDNRGSGDPVTRMAFLIEDEDLMAARMDGAVVEVPTAPPSQFRQEQASLLYLFQFMIGNTDWAISKFHNVKAMVIGWEYFPVPYDFDWSGLVDAPYAIPNEIIIDRIDDVRERLYWGVCDDAIDYPALFDRFNQQRSAILELTRSIPLISERNRRSAVGYLEEFFQIINSESAARRQIVNACRQ